VERFTRATVPTSAAAQTPSGSTDTAHFRKSKTNSRPAWASNVCHKKRTADRKCVVQIKRDI